MNTSQSSVPVAPTPWLLLAGLAWAGFAAAFFAHTAAPQAAGAGLAAVVGGALGWWTGRRMSGAVIEPGLVPLGAVGILLVLLHAVATGGAWLASESLWLAAFAALYLRPLLALVAAHPARPGRRALALTLPLAVGGLLGAAAAVLLADQRGIAARAAVLAALHTAATLVILVRAPEFFMRLVVWVLVHVLYRIDVKGLEHIPREGAVLVTCNHVSFVDALILGGLLRRPTRFVMYHRIFQIPVLNAVFRAARAIPIAPAKEDPALLARAYEEIAAALRAGEVVGIFPEGGLTPDGAVQAFKSGVEKILAASPVPVVPMALCGLWSSMWSRRDSRLRRARLPRRLRARIALHVAAPLPPQAVTAAVLEAQIRQLRGDCP